MTADLEPEVGAGLRTTTWAGAGLALLIGAVVLAGWAFTLPALTQFALGRSAMQPVTALCAILAAVGVIATSRSDKPRFRAVALGGIVLLVAAVTLVEHLVGVDFGTDRLLFPDAIAAQPVRYTFPGRMAVPTAAAFALAGMTLVLARARARVAGLALSVGATAVLLLVTIALLGHLFGVAPLTGVLGFTQVSLPTSLALGGLSIGLLSLRPDVGWIRLLTGKTVGSAAARWLLPIVVIVPVAVAWTAFQGSKAGLYPPDFRLALITAATIVLLAALTIWGTTQLDTLHAVRRTAEALRESEATLRAFFETRGLFASIIEWRGDDVRYVTSNKAFAGFFGRDDIAGLAVRDLNGEDVASAMLDQLKAIEASGAPVSVEHPVDTPSGTRWFAVTISPVAGRSVDAPRFATASVEITQRKRAEAHQKLLIDELHHRVKNMLAIVQSLAQQSFRGDRASPAAKQAFEARLSAVAAAHDLLVRQNWEAASLLALASEAAGPGCGADRARIDIEGPDIELPSKTAVSLALALHELCTNAVKYGALSNRTGRVAVRWSIEGGEPRRLRMSWTESGGPPVVAPSARGFGSRLIERGLAAELGGPVTLDFRPEGLVCTIDAPLPRVDAKPSVRGTS